MVGGLSSRTAGGQPASAASGAGATSSARATGWSRSTAASTSRARTLRWSSMLVETWTVSRERKCSPIALTDGRA